MNRELKKEYKKEIKEIKKQNFETLLLTLKYSVETMIESVDGINQSMQVLEDVYQIINEEKRLLNFIKVNLKKIDANELDNLLDSLDELNEETIKYYYHLLDNITCDKLLEKNYRRISTLLDTDKFRKEIFGLCLSMKDIIKYLDYSPEFWEYILPRTTRIDEESFYQVNIKCDAQEIRVFVPNIINLETAKINIHEFKHAYDMYRILGIPYFKDDYEASARKEEEKFENDYVHQKVKKYFG